MKNDPYTLTVALSKAGDAKGELYMDDGYTFAHEKGELVWRGLEAKTDKKTSHLVLSSRDLAREKPDMTVNQVDLVAYDASQNSYAKSIANVRFEKVVILGLGNMPKSIKTGDGRIPQWSWTNGVKAKSGKDGEASVLVIKDPGLLVTKDWELIIEQ